MTAKIRWAIICVLAGATLPTMGATPRLEITRAEVASAIGDAGLQVLPEQVILLSDVITKTGTPRLTVAAMEPWDAHRLRVRMNCGSVGDCLPFYVAVEFFGVHDLQRPQAEHDALRNVGADVKQRAVLRVGAPAVLLLEGARIHIRLAVSCLESGYVGQTIRVVDKERHTYLATVGIDGYLRGSL